MKLNYSYLVIFLVGFYPLFALDSVPSSTESLYQEVSCLLDVGSIFFSKWEESPQEIAESRDMYEVALKNFIEIIDLYEKNLEVSFAAEHDVLTKDSLQKLYKALDTSVKIILDSKEEALPLWQERKVLLLEQYLLIQNYTAEYFYFLSKLNQISGSVITIMLCVFSILTIIILIFFLYSKKKQAILSQLEKRVNEQKLVVKIQEAERERMGVELHDTIAQDLKVFKMFFSQLEVFVPKSDETKKLLEQIHQLESHSLTSLYNILNKLIPPELEAVDFKGVLLSLCNDFIRSSGLECVFYIEPGTPLNDLGKDSRIQLFRIIQEALTNVEQHSKASSCIVSIREQNNRIIIFITDDGVGLEKTQENKNPNYGGFGLRGMESRTALMGGDFKIRWDDEGTEIRLEIPIS